MTLLNILINYIDEKIGDFSQLSPVLDEHMYSQISRHDPLLNDEEQQNFRAILLRLRDGESTADDWKIFARINAVHTGGDETRKADSNAAKDLEAKLLLAKGARIMLIDKRRFSQWFNGHTWDGEKRDLFTTSNGS
ncbi:hypothetical protein C1645_837975 [Glomus cerebriforme]|uniref:Uncharacterized protein n=1 Tax=Glomus cerebriforme TaxID=658196 RepID=A0A397S352_9GLOM|nr:hypothetical protein C1645_837975 [Glomus cerebriforme]